MLCLFSCNILKKRSKIREPYKFFPASPVSLIYLGFIRRQNSVIMPITKRSFNQERWRLLEKHVLMLNGHSDLAEILFYWGRKKRSINIGRSSIETTKEAHLQIREFWFWLKKLNIFFYNETSNKLVFVFPSVARTTKQILHKICILVHVTGHSCLTEKKNYLGRKSDRLSPDTTRNYKKDHL